MSKEIDGEDEAREQETQKLPFSRAVMNTVLAFVFATGGFGIYRVVKDYPGYGVDLDERHHQDSGSD